MTDYARMSHAALLALRDSLPDDDPMQRVLAPYEHAAFAREWTQDSPATAVPSLLVSIPAYSIAKRLGLVHARTPASLAEVGQGFRGLGQGLMTYFERAPHG